MSLSRLRQLLSSRKGWRCFFSFLLALTTVLLTTSCVFAATLFRQDYLLGHMEKSSYYPNTTRVLREQYADYGLPAGIEESFFDNAIDEDALYRHIRGAINAAYAGETYTIDTVALKDALYQKLLTYADEKGVKVTKQIQTNLSHLSDLCISAYQKQANQALLRMLGQYTHQFRTALWIAIGILAAMEGLCLWMIFRLSTLPHRALRYCNSGWLGAAIMLAAVPAWLYLSKGVERLGITSRSLYPLMVSYTNSLFMSFIVCGTVIAVAVCSVGVIGTHILKRHHQL